MSRVRSGLFLIEQGGRTFKLLTPTLEDEFMANEAFRKSYERARDDELMTEEEMFVWMKEKGLWLDKQDELLVNIHANLEKLKLKSYENRGKPDILSQAKLYLRATETALADTMALKNENFSKTCEGIATQEKTFALFSRCCFDGSDLIDIEQVDLSSLYYKYNKSLLGETDLRELSRNEPWKLAWIMKDHTNLFANEQNRMLSQDQKGLVLWSNMYDNIQESPDCPSEDVINDDDVLDGWFIIQRKKAASERAKQDIESKTSSKIANSDEIMIMASSRKEADAIHAQNSVHGEHIRRQRLATVKAKGKAVDLDFPDRRLDVRAQQNRNFKEKGKR